jgi:hypothetical protein
LILNTRSQDSILLIIGTSPLTQKLSLDHHHYWHFRACPRIYLLIVHSTSIHSIPPPLYFYESCQLFNSSSLFIKSTAFRNLLIVSMSSQDKVQSNNRGKVREDLAAAPGSGPSPQTQANEQRSDKSSQISPIDLSKLSTAPPLDKVNNRIDKWLSTTRAPSTGGSPSTQNQENVPLSGDSGATGQDELTKEIDALTKGLFNTQGNPGTIAPANTPQSYDSNGLRARAQSAGDCTGKRPHMGPQAKTMEEGDLPKPLLLRSKSNTVAEASLLKGSQSSMTPGAFEPNASKIPREPVKHTPPPHGSAQTTSATKANISTLPTLATASPTAPSTNTPALDGPGINNHDVLENFLEQYHGVSPPMAQFLKGNVAGKPSTLTAAEPSLTPPSLAGKTINSHGLAQPPSPLNFQHAQDNVHLPISGPGRTRPMGVLTELESINNSPPASRFQYFSDLGCRHSSHASIGEAFSHSLMSSS